MSQVIEGLHRPQFPGNQAAPYLDTAAVGILSTAASSAAIRMMTEHQNLGIAAWVAGADPQKQEATERVARLINGSPSRIAFTQNTSTGLALVSNGILWRAGDNIVVPEGEFPSNFYVWTGLRRHGVQVREVPMPRGYASIDDLHASIDERTKVVALSAVQYSSGYRYELQRLGEICAEREALLVVDGTQALGAMRIDVIEAAIDVLVVSAHKWMLAPLGIAFAHFSERALETLHPSTVGWLSVDRPFDFTHEPLLAPDARRFESGTENAAGILGLSAAVELVLALGAAEVEAHVLKAADYLAELLAREGWSVLNAHPYEHRSGILILSSGGDDAKYHKKLLGSGVRCSLRGGGVRFSPHYFTSSSDLELVADIIAR